MVLQQGKNTKRQRTLNNNLLVLLDEWMSACNETRRSIFVCFAHCKLHGKRKNTIANEWRQNEWSARQQKREKKKRIEKANTQLRLVLLVQPNRQSKEWETVSTLPLLFLSGIVPFNHVQFYVISYRTCSTYYTIYGVCSAPTDTIQLHDKWATNRIPILPRAHSYMGREKAVFNEWTHAFVFFFIDTRAHRNSPIDRRSSSLSQPKCLPTARPQVKCMKKLNANIELSLYILVFVLHLWFSEDSDWNIMAIQNRTLSSQTHTRTNMRWLELNDRNFHAHIANCHDSQTPPNPLCPLSISKAVIAIKRSP